MNPSPQSPIFRTKGILLVALFTLLAAGINAGAQTLVLSNVWNLSNTNYPFLTNDNNVRGIAFNPATSNLLVASRTGSNAVHVLNGRSGVKVGNLNMGIGIISGGGGAVMNMINVADDGAIYLANLATDSAASGLKVYRWDGEDSTNLPYVVYSGDPSGAGAPATNRRFGDNLDVRGAGTNTQILLGSRNGTNAVVLTTVDGTNFTAIAIATDAGAAAFGRSVCWGPTNTFFGKDTTTLRKFSVDLITGRATTLNNFSISIFGASAIPVGYDVSRNLLAIVDIGANRNLRVFDLSDPSNPTQVGAAITFPLPTGSNGNGTGSVDFGGGAVYGLSTANGILAVDIAVSTAPVAPSISGQPAAISAYDGASNQVLSVIASGTTPLSYSWFQNGSVVAGAATNFIRFSPIGGSAAGSYFVIVTNTAGAVTSSVAVVTVLPTLNSALTTNAWSLPPGSRPYLSDSDNSQRSIAFNPVTTNLLVVSRALGNAVIVLDAKTGAERHQLIVDPSTITGGTFALNQIGVTDDGVVFGANLTTAANSPPLNLYRWDNDSPTTAPLLVGQHDPGAPTGIAAAETQPGIRWGDALTVRGAVSNSTTEILLAPSTGTNVAVLRVDPSGFFSADPTYNSLVRVLGAPAGFAHLGIAWAPGTNAFWAKGSGSLLRLVEYDFLARTGVVVRSYSTASPLSVPLASSGPSYHPGLKLLGVVANEAPDNARLYDVSDLDLGPVLRDQKLFGTDNPNINNTTASAFGAGKFFALSANNGLIAMNLNNAFNPGVPVFSLTNQFAVTTTLNATNNAVIVRWPSTPGRVYRLESKDDLSFSNWTTQVNLSAPAVTTIVTNIVDGLTNRVYRVRAL